MGEQRKRMKTVHRWRISSIALLLFIFTFIQMIGVSGSVFASGTSPTYIQKQVANQLPLSAFAYTEAAGSSDVKWVPVDRYLANLEPTGDYPTSVAKVVYQDSTGGAVMDVVPSTITDWETVVMGWSASGNDATNINGVNLVQKLYSKPVNTDGTMFNAVIFDLIALDSKSYTIPSQAVTTRDSLVQEILSAQLPGGGWGWLTLDQGQWEAANYDNQWNFIGYRAATDQDFNTDITGMVLTALSPYYQTNPTVKAALDKAAVYLQQNGSTTNCNSLSQMIIGLSALGIDTTSLVQNLLSTYLDQTTALFKNYLNKPDALATQDAIGAMASYLKYVNSGGLGSVYYHMSGPGKNPDIDQQIAAQLPISGAAFTQSMGSTNTKWVAIDRYLANLMPTDDYVSSVSQEVYKTVTQDVYPSSITDQETLIMGWTSAGKDATNINGVNLVEKLYQHPMDGDGTMTNAVVFDLIALDTKPYTIPAQVVTTRDGLVQEILSAQLPSGGWGWLTLDHGTWKAANYDTSWNFTGYRPAGDSDFNTDITGMALTALAPYYASNSSVKAAVDKAVTLLLQKGTPTNCNSLSQMIIGLSAVGVDTTSLVQTLFTYLTDNGLFKGYDNNPNALATQDAIGAMAAYQKYKHAGNGSIYYRMSGPGTLSDPTLPAIGGGSGGGVGGVNEQQKGNVTFTVIGDHGQTLYPFTTIVLQPGDTALSILLRTLGSSVVYSGSGPSAYVKSIFGLAEFDKGPLSGWLCKVGASYISVSSGSTALKDGDAVQWIYSDVGNPDDKNSNNNVQSASTASATLATDTKSLPISYDNKLPINQVVQSVVVKNADEPMTKGAIEALKQTLQDNKIQLSENVSVDKDQVISDAKKEIQLYVPQYALSSAKTISVEKLEPNSKELLSPIYDFTPNGTHFEKPVTITVQVPLQVEDLSQVALVWWDETGNQWIPIPAVVDASTGMVSGQVNHFTKFAVIDRSKLGVSQDVTEQIQSGAKYLFESGDLSDWGAFALTRAGQPVPQGYLDAVKKQLEQNQGSFHKITDYERMVLGILAAGQDPQNIDGYNLVEHIYNNDRLTSQGTNGAIFALVALDSGNFETPNDALWNRDKLVAWLLQNQNQDGGWSLVPGDASDLDITSMALAGLAPYKTRDDVKKAIDAAVQWIVQSNGTVIQNSESLSQEIQGLLAVGANPMDSKFNRGGQVLIDSLLQYQQADGGFAHQLGQGSDQMATEQAVLALAAYKSNGEGSLYQFTVSSAKPASVNYTDADQISSWAVDSVAQARINGLMKGISETPPTFAPKQPVTRAQFATIMLRLLGKSSVQVTAEKNSNFDDVQPGDWYYNDVRAAKEAGLVHGVSSTSFAPNAPITREQMAVMIANAYHLQPTAQTTFGDQNEIDGYALSALQALHEKGLLVGYNGGIQPLGEATREMVAALAVRLYEENQTH